MPVESWITPEEAPALAAAAITKIEAALSGLSEAQRDAFWNSVRKCYNTPYNDPPPRKRTFAVSAVIAEFKAREFKAREFKAHLPAPPPALSVPMQAGTEAA
jgi:hypothetical protein